MTATVHALPEIPLPDSLGVPAHVKAAAVFLGAGYAPWRVWLTGWRCAQIRACARAMRRLRKQGVTPAMCAELLGWDTP
jgi:hypothetical protein